MLAEMSLIAREQGMDKELDKMVEKEMKKIKSE